MGTPKHLLSEGGHLWIERAVTTLGSLVEQVVIAGNGALPGSLMRVPRVEDAAGLAGPLAGILGAFRRYPEVSWLIVACDQPHLSVDALQWLLGERNPETLAILPSLAKDGRVEPLLAYYDRRCASVLEAMAAEGSRRMNALVKASGVVSPQPPVDLRGAWNNINRPDELERHRQALHGRQRPAAATVESGQSHKSEK